MPIGIMDNEKYKGLSKIGYGKDVKKKYKGLSEIGYNEDEKKKKKEKESEKDKPGLSALQSALIKEAKTPIEKLGAISGTLLGNLIKNRKKKKKPEDEEEENMERDVRE